MALAEPRVSRSMRPTFFHVNIVERHIFYPQRKRSPAPELDPVSLKQEQETDAKVNPARFSITDPASPTLALVLGVG